MSARERKVRPFPNVAQRKQELSKAKAEPRKNYYALQKYASLRYDYADIDEAHRQQVMDAALDIRVREKRVMQDLIFIGQQLLKIRKWMPSGQFVHWMKSEFGWSNGSAYDFINMALRADQISKFGNLGISTARLLSAPSVPLEVVRAVIELNEARSAEQMPQLSVIEVRALKRQMCPPPPPEPLQLTDSQHPDATYTEYRVVEPTSAAPQLPPGITVNPLGGIWRADDKRDPHDPRQFVDVNYERVLAWAKGRGEITVVRTPASDEDAAESDFEEVTVRLPRALAQKLHAALLIHNLRHHMNMREQDQLVALFTEALEG